MESVICLQDFKKENWEENFQSRYESTLSVRGIGDLSEHRFHRSLCNGVKDHGKCILSEFASLFPFRNDLAEYYICIWKRIAKTFTRCYHSHRLNFSDSTYILRQQITRIYILKRIYLRISSIHTFGNYFWVTWHKFVPLHRREKITRIDVTRWFNCSYRRTVYRCKIHILYIYTYI